MLQSTEISYYSYVYRISHKIKNKHYYGVRYCKMNSRYSLNALDDLKQYKSSSTDKAFKQELEDFPENFKFKIIKLFDTSDKALAYEAKLHRKFSIDVNENFYNITSSDFSTSSKYDGTIIYDLKNKEHITIAFKEFYNDTGVDVSLFYIQKVKILNGRYCLPHNIDECNKVYIKDNTEYTLYYFNSKGVFSRTEKYLNWCKILGSDNSSRLLILNKFYSCLNYYIDEILCLEAYTKEYKKYTLYTYNNCTNSIESIEKTYNRWLSILGETTGMILTKNIIKSSYGYYIDKEDCIKANKLITIYRYNYETETIDSHTFRYCNYLTIPELDTNFPRVLAGERKHNNKYYISLEECKKDYTKYFFIKDEQVISTLLIDASKIIGKNVLRTISNPKSYPICCGYKIVDKIDIPSYN